MQVSFWNGDREHISWNTENHAKKWGGGELKERIILNLAYNSSTVLGHVNISKTQE